MAVGTDVGVGLDSTMPAVGGAESQAASASAGSVRTRSASVRKGRVSGQRGGGESSTDAQRPLSCPVQAGNQRQLPIALKPSQSVHCLHASYTRRHFVVPAKAGTSHPCPLSRHSSEGWNPSEGSGDREWNEMEPNGTELKVSPLLPTPDDAHRGNSEATPAQRVRVNGGPKRSHTRLISIARLGVNEANQGQMGPRFRPPIVPRRRDSPRPLGEGQGEGSGHPALIARTYDSNDRK